MKILRFKEEGYVALTKKLEPTNEMYNGFISPNEVNLQKAKDKGDELSIRVHKRNINKFEIERSGVTVGLDNLANGLVEVRKELYAKVKV